MASARRRIVLDLSTAVKQRRGIGIAALMVKQWSTNKCPYIQNRDLSTSVMKWSGTPQWPSYNLRLFGNPYTRHSLGLIGYTVDVADLLFTPQRDFLLRNNAQKIKVDDLLGKTIVLFIVPLDAYTELRSGTVERPGAGDTWDMIDAYHELRNREGSDVEFVFVPVRIHARAGNVDDREEGFFHDIFSAVPFPAIPLSDAQPQEGPVVQTFSLDDPRLYWNDWNDLPYWVVIDPTNTVVATRYFYSDLFKLFGGAELHPLTRERIKDLHDSHESESRLHRISKWDELLASDTRDFLLSSNGDKVPISSLKGKLVGLYFCENIPHPPRMQVIKKVYEEAKSRGYDFEIVQITFHYHPFNAIYCDTNPSVQQCCEEVSWLTLPFKDPSCRKVQRILHCLEEEDTYWFSEDFDDAEHWVGDNLILIHPHQGEAETEGDQSSGVQFELSGAEILEIWGIEGYPFTRQSLNKLEYEVQKREVTLQSLFPPGEHLLRPVGDGYDLVDAVSQLSGKRVLVLFAAHYGNYSDRGGNVVSMLKSEYVAQQEDNVEEESKFEVVYVSTGHCIDSFDEFTKDMPWLVRPFSKYGIYAFLPKCIKANARASCAVAFNKHGELIAKANPLPETKEGEKLQFPFIDRDLEKSISYEVEAMCNVANFVGKYF